MVSSEVGPPGRGFAATLIHDAPHTYQPIDSPGKLVLWLSVATRAVLQLRASAAGLVAQLEDRAGDTPHEVQRAAVA